MDRWKAWVRDHLIPGRLRPVAERWYGRARVLLYRGSRFTCPCCGGRFRKLRPYGVRPRPDACCPKCGSLERHRLLWLYLASRTNLFSDPIRFLHFAPEDVLQKRIAGLANVDYFSADLDASRAMVALDIVSLPYEDDTFDAILCSHVLEHVPDDRAAMRELRRILKPGGWAILQTPIDGNRQESYEDPVVVAPEDRERAFGQRDHVRIYGLDYADRLEEAGFHVDVDGYVRTLPADLVRTYALMPGEDIYFCTKPGLDA